jgi:gas vesicle protein
MKQDEKRAFWKENGLKFLIGLLVGVAVTSISFLLFGK